MGKAIIVPNADFYGRNLGKVTKADLYIDGVNSIFWEGVFKAYLADGTPVSANWSVSGPATISASTGKQVTVETTGRGIVSLTATYGSYTFTKQIESTNDGYIKNGLVLYLDGADCNGTTWVDRARGKVFTLHNASIDGQGVVFNTTAGKPSYAQCTADAIAVTPTAGTIEVCAYRRAVIAAEGEYVVHTGTINRLCYVTNKARTGVAITTNNTNNAPFVNENTGKREKFVHSINSARHYYNGVVGTFGSNATANRYGNGAFIGCRSDGHFAFQGTVYQVRIYNRQLTEEEILHNQSIDAEKYGITLNTDTE